MKKIIPVIMLLALVLSGCGLTDQISEVRERYIDPAIEKASNGGVDTYIDDTGFVSSWNVLTNRTLYTEYEPETRIASRLSDAYIGELVASASYGRIMPYIASCVYGTDGSVLGVKYGLVSERGTIVLDGVLDGVTALTFTDSNGAETPLGIYVLGKYDEASGTTSYAVCGADGSWATDFDYTDVVPMALGALCIEDEQANLAVCYGSDGKVVFDTSTFSNLNLLAEGTVRLFTDYGNGYMRFQYKTGSYGYIVTSGEILNLSRIDELPVSFDESVTFSEGKAAVKVGTSWYYILADGTYAFDQIPFEEAYSFHGGMAVVKMDGLYSVINTDGEALHTFHDVSSVELTDSWLLVDGAYYSRSTFEQTTVDGAAATVYSGGFWAAADGGVKAVDTNSVSYFFSGASELTDYAGSLWLMRLADGTMAVMDSYSRVIVSGSDLALVTDAVTGDVYIRSGDSLYGADGSLMADGLLLRNGQCDFPPVDGMSLCATASSAGWKSLSNEWVFRLPLDNGD